MPCDRCGGRLVEYELRGRVSTVCEECESIDVLVEHEPPSRPSESWDEALDRFHEQVQQSDDADAASATEPAQDATPSEADDQTGSGSDVPEDEQGLSAGPGSPDDDSPETAGDADDGDSTSSQDDPNTSADVDDSGGTEDQPSSRRQALKKIPRE